MDGLRGYAPQAYYAGAATTNGAPQPKHQYVMNGSASQVSTHGPPTRRTVVMSKLPGERSFGMTLEQHVHVAPTDYPRVSFVFPNSAAFRAGMQSGWAIEFINGAPSVGRTVSDVATIFRNLTQVTLYVDTSQEAPAPAPAPAPIPPPVPFPAAPAPMHEPFVPPQRQPQSQFPLGGASFAALMPPNMLGMSVALTSTPMTSAWTPTMSTMAPVPATASSFSSVPQSSAAVANGLSNQAYATATTQAAPTRVNTSAQVSHPVTTAYAAPVSAQVAVVAPTPPSAPVSHPVLSQNATLVTATTSSATTNVPAPPATPAAAPSSAPAMVLQVARPPAQRPVTAVPPATTAPVVTSAVASTPVAPPVSSVATPALVPPAAPRPQQAPRPAVNAAPALPVRIAHESAFTLPAMVPPSTAPVAAATSTPTSTPPVSSAVSTSSEVAAAAAATTQTTTGRRRRRSTATEATAPAAPAATGRRRGRPPKRARASTVSDVWDSDDAAFFYASDDDVEVVESPQPSSANGSRRSTRQSESGGRQRRSLTVSRLMTMGFKEEDAQASVEACGQDPDKCMVWIVSHLEEKQFLNDLNKASIESEQQKRLEAQEQKKQESETLRQATAFTSLFPSSYILCNSAEATRLHEMLASTIGEIAADTLVRTLMTKLLTVESKAVRWYKEAAKCYMLQLAGRLETAYTGHDAVTCCAQIMATEPASNGCSFVQALHEEEQALTKALFSMPENHGGVPLEFLRADESMQFSLDDDGFEVVDVPPPGSPGHE